MANTSFYPGFEKELDKAGKRLLDNIMGITSMFSRSNGKLTMDDETQMFLNQRFESFVGALKDAGFTDLSRKFSMELMNEAPEIVGDTATALNVGFGWADIDHTTIEGLAQFNHEALMEIGASNVNHIKGQITQHILAGTTEKELIDSIAATIDKKFVNYAKTYAWTGIHLFNQKVSDLSLAEFGIKPDEVHYRYIGPLDKKNRPECRRAVLKKVFTHKERQDFEKTYGLRWNCRHKFMPIPIEGRDYEAMAAAKLGKKAPLPTHMSRSAVVSSYKRMNRRQRAKWIEETAKAEELIDVANDVYTVKVINFNPVDIENLRGAILALDDVASRHHFPESIYNKVTISMNITYRDSSPGTLGNFWSQMNRMELGRRNMGYNFARGKETFYTSYTPWNAAPTPEGNLAIGGCRAVTTHELGHWWDNYVHPKVIAKAQEKGLKKIGSIPIEDLRCSELTTGTLNETAMNTKYYHIACTQGKKYQVSRYALKNTHEYVAEIFSAYMHGITERIPDQYLEYFKFAETILKEGG